ncbi:hypothetical protein VCHA47P369_70204 [Vibrio chagasii]|nr:hypothetical protein VCHA47P369_70204 [Vibrio chagasii]CAH7370190.1 hypothetical protein VCHA51O448_60152 [Vibrio chagasii]
MGSSGSETIANNVKFPTSTATSSRASRSAAVLGNSPCSILPEGNP